MRFFFYKVNVDDLMLLIVPEVFDYFGVYMYMIHACYWLQLLHVHVHYGLFHIYQMAHFP